MIEKLLASVILLPCAVVVSACSEEQSRMPTQMSADNVSECADMDASVPYQPPGTSIVCGSDVPVGAAMSIFASGMGSSPRILVNSIGVDQEQAESIKQELNEFLESYEELGSRLMRETCSRREMFVTRDDLAREHERRETLLEEGRQEMFFAILDKLPTDVAERLMQQVERTRRNTSGTSLDPYVYYHEAEVDVEEYLDRVCEIISRVNTSP